GLSSARRVSTHLQSDAEIHLAFCASRVAKSFGPVVQSQTLRTSHLRLKRDPWAGDSAPSLQRSQLLRVRGRLRRTRRGPLGCSSDRHTSALLRLLRHLQHSGDGRFAKSASAIYAICTPARDVFYLASADIGIEPVQRPFTPERSVRREKPLNGPFLITNHRNHMSINPGKTDGAVRLGGCQPGPLAQAASHRPLWNSELLQQRGVAQGEFYGQRPY